MLIHNSHLNTQCFKDLKSTCGLLNDLIKTTGVVFEVLSTFRFTWGTNQKNTKDRSGSPRHQKHLQIIVILTHIAILNRKRKLHIPRWNIFWYIKFAYTPKLKQEKHCIATTCFLHCSEHYQPHHMCLLIRSGWDIYRKLAIQTSRNERNQNRIPRNTTFLW